MLSLTKKTIAQALFVIVYPRDLLVRTRQFDIEKAFSPFISSPSVNTNIPDDFNPQAPRVTMADGEKSVHFSQVAAQLTINFDNTNGKSLDLIRDSIVKQVNLFQECVDKVISTDQQRERGLVLTVHYPVDFSNYPDEVVFDYIQSNFLRVTPLGVPASAGFSAGYKTDDNFFFTLSVAQYRTVGGDVPASLTDQWFDISMLPLVESGVELKIDINSRPFLDKVNQPINVTNIILEKSFDFVLTKADKFMEVHK